MKRRELIKKITSAGCALVRHGARRESPGLSALIIYRGGVVRIFGPGYWLKG